MTSEVARLRERIVMHGQSLHARGLVPGSSGNISARTADGILVTPTNSCLGRLDPARISLLDLNGNHLSGDQPSKEAFLHMAFYKRRSNATSVVHLHSHGAVAISCRADLSDQNPINSYTPYFVMKIGRLKVLPYFAPGTAALAEAVEAVADRYQSMLLSNHGPVVAGKDLDSAVYAIEELEAAALLHLELEKLPANALTDAQIAQLRQMFGPKEST